ncbi:MAG: extracellular solute-binding protein [Clostridia bacterium]|nr:extracellular solute-binding protein [Clostridia bacterium]
MKTRILTLCLAALLLVSCGGNTVPAETEPVPDAAETETQAEETQLTDGLEGYDFGGQIFSIVYSQDQLGTGWPYNAEEQTGDMLNDTVWERNTTAEERFNVLVEYTNVGGTGSEVPTALTDSVTAGDNAYQLAISHTFNNVPAMTSGGYLTDFNEIPAVDLNKPWWNASIRENLQIAGVLPIGVSDLIHSYADVIYVNQNMLTEHGLENPYDLVMDGKWTWTKLAEMAETVTADTNGDGKFTIDDRYGYTTPGETISLMSRLVHSNGMLFATPDAEGFPQLITMSDRLQTAMERYYALIHTGNQTYVGTKTDKLGSVEAFVRGDILFMHQTTLQLPALRDTEVHFGIVPLPKYDEAQEEYMSMLSSQLLLVPSMDTELLEMTGVVLEGLSYESWRLVVPAVYESIFAHKYLRDATSYDMYLQIRNSLVCDFNWNYGNGNAITYIVSKLIWEQKSTNVASYLAANTPPVEKAFADLYTAVSEVYGAQ